MTCVRWSQFLINPEDARDSASLTRAKHLPARQCDCRHGGAATEFAVDIGGRALLGPYRTETGRRHQETRAPPGSSALQWLRPKAVEMRVLGDAAIAHFRLPKWHLTIRNTCSTFARTLPNLFTLASRQPAAGFGLLLHRPEPLRDALPPLRTLSSSVSCASSRCRKFQIVVSSGIGSRPSSRSQNARIGSMS